MTLEGKLRKVAVIAAVDISLKRIGRSPERCARNLIELGTNAYPNALSKKDQVILYSTLLCICEANNTQGAKELFIKTFLSE